MEKKSKKRKPDDMGLAGPSSSSLHLGQTPLVFTYASDADSDEEISNLNQGKICNVLQS